MPTSAQLPAVLERLAVTIDRAIEVQVDAGESLASRLCEASAIPESVLDDQTLRHELDVLALLMGAGRNLSIPGAEPSVGGDPPALLLLSHFRALAPRVYQIADKRGGAQAQELVKSTQPPQRVDLFGWRGEDLEETPGLVLGWRLRKPRGAMIELSRFGSESGANAMTAMLQSMADTYPRRESVEDFWYAAVGVFVLARTIDRLIGVGRVPAEDIDEALSSGGDPTIALGQVLFRALA